MGSHTSPPGQDRHASHFDPLERRRALSPDASEILRVPHFEQLQPFGGGEFGHARFLDLPELDLQMPLGRHLSCVSGGHFFEQMRSRWSTLALLERALLLEDPVDHGLKVGDGPRLRIATWTTARRRWGCSRTLLESSRAI